jgi:hypothetical protein
MGCVMTNALANSFSVTSVWGEQVSKLATADDGDYRLLILAYMAKVYRQWLPGLKMPRLTKARNAKLKAAALVAHEFLALLDLIQQVCPHHLRGRHQAEWLGDALMEWEILGNMYWPDLPDTFSYFEALQNMARENHSLTSLSQNPFAKPTSKMVFDVALAAVATGRRDCFTSQLQSFVKARQSLIKSLSDKPIPRLTSARCET